MTNQINYFEIGSPDPAASRAFYGGLFDWSIEEPTGPASYSMVDGGNGGLWDTSQMGGATWAIFYVQVDDVPAAVEQAVALGGSVVHPVTDNGQIHFAHLADPQGSRFGVWRPNDA